MISASASPFGKEETDWANELRTARATTWRADSLGLVKDAGDMGGDTQAGPAYEIRFVRDDLFGALVTVSTWASVTETSGGDELGWDGRVEYLTCTDPTDPGGTETWSRVDYMEGSALVSPDLGHADHAAHAEAQRWLTSVNDYISWDGKPFDK